MTTPMPNLSAGQRPGRRAQACGNCHSNRTNWPWYSHAAPVSRWIRSHVRKRREELNFSTWPSYSARQRRARLDSICGVISTGRMPPWSYTIMHPGAKLTAKDKKRSEEHTSELQSHLNLVCRLLLEKKK